MFGGAESAYISCGRKGSGQSDGGHSGHELLRKRQSTEKPTSNVITGTRRIRVALVMRP